MGLNPAVAGSHLGMAWLWIFIIFRHSYASMQFLHLFADLPQCILAVARGALFLDAVRRPAARY